jgi:hypothetical protein
MFSDFNFSLISFQFTKDISVSTLFFKQPKLYCTKQLQFKIQLPFLIAQFLGANGTGFFRFPYSRFPSTSALKKGRMFPPIGAV